MIEHPAIDKQVIEDWPLRPWVLAGLGALAGLAIHLIFESEGESGWGAALAAFFFFSFAAACFVLRPVKWVEPVVFSLGLGVVMGGIAYLAADATDRMAGREFAFAAGVFFSLLAIPLFQADFHRRRWATPYGETHFYVWTDAVSAGGAVAFVLLSWLLLWLLHGLFSLIGIDLIEEMINTDGFAGAFMGATFGAAMGVLRNQLAIIGALQRVVMLVFSLLAVPFAAAIALFLVILLVSGGSALWETIDYATPVLLACAVGCFVLANTIVRDSDEERSGNVVLQAAALVLAASILPLTVFAAVSMGIRIDQHGLSPERIWALVAIMIACAYGLAYWVGLARGRLARWAHYLRRANLHLAAATCVVALVLALPIIDFGSISAQNQIARLQAGKVTTEEFDYAALRWDFGDAGRDMLAQLAESGGEVARLAAEAQSQETRPGYWERQLRTGEFNLDVQPDDPEVREFVLAELRDEPWGCEDYCLALDLGPNENGQREIAVIQHYAFKVLVMPGPGEAGEVPVRRAQHRGRLREGATVELRSVPQRYIFIDGAPMNEPVDIVPADEDTTPAE